MTFETTLYMLQNDTLALWYGGCVDKGGYLVTAILTRLPYHIFKNSIGQVVKEKKT